MIRFPQIFSFSLIFVLFLGLVDKVKFSIFLDRCNEVPDKLEFRGYGFWVKYMCVTIQSCFDDEKYNVDE